MSELEEIKKWIEEEINCPITDNEWDETQYVNAGKILKYLEQLQQSQPLQLSESDFKFDGEFYIYKKNNICIGFNIEQNDCSNHSEIYGVFYIETSLYYIEKSVFLQDYRTQKIDTIMEINNKLAEIHKATSKEEV